MSSFWFFLILFINVIYYDVTLSIVYNTCDMNSMTTDTYKLCKIFQSIDFSQTFASTFDATQTNYCGTEIGGFEIVCDVSPPNTVVEVVIQGSNLFPSNGILNHTDGLGWPSNIRVLELRNQYPRTGFDFSSIYGLQNLQELLLQGNSNDKNDDSELTITANDWLEIAKLPSLKLLDIAYRAWEGNMGVINQWNGPLETLNIQLVHLDGTFNWTSFKSVENTLRNFNAWSLGNNGQGGLVTGVIDFDAFVNCVNLFDLRAFNNKWEGQLTTTNSDALPPGINTIQLQKNLLSGQIDWQIFREITGLKELKLSDNNFDGTIDWDIIRYLSGKGLNQLLLQGNRFTDTKADFRGIVIPDFTLDVSVWCDEDIYCQTKYGFRSTIRTKAGIGSKGDQLHGVSIACTCQCTNGTHTIQSFLCPGAPTFQPTPSPTGIPTNSPSIPTILPTLGPSVSPSNTPSETPTLTPVINPTESPTIAPSLSPDIVNAVPVQEKRGLSLAVLLIIITSIVIIPLCIMLMCCLTLYCFCAAKSDEQSMISADTTIYEAGDGPHDTHTRAHVVSVSADGHGQQTTVAKFFQHQQLQQQRKPSDDQTDTYYENMNEEKESELRGDNETMNTQEKDAHKILIMEMSKILNQTSNNMGMPIGQARDGDGNIVTGMDNEMFKIFLNLPPKDQDTYLNLVHNSNSTLKNTMLQRANNEPSKPNIPLPLPTSPQSEINPFQSPREIRNPLPQIVNETNPNTPVNHRLSVPSLPPTLPPGKNDNYQNMLYSIQENNVNNTNNHLSPKQLSPMIKLKQNHKILHQNIIHNNNNHNHTNHHNMDDITETVSVSYSPASDNIPNNNNNKAIIIPKPMPPIDATYNNNAALIIHDNHINNNNNTTDTSEISSYHPQKSNKHSKKRLKDRTKHLRNDNVSNKKSINSHSINTHTKSSEYKNNRYILNPQDPESPANFDNDYLSTNKTSNVSMSEVSSATSVSTVTDDSDKPLTKQTPGTKGATSKYSESTASSETTDESSEADDNDSNSDSNSDDNSSQNSQSHSISDHSSFKE